jgi:hypothetical protein
MRTNNNNPQVNQKVEIFLCNTHYIVKIIKKKKDFFTVYQSMLYLCEFENSERRWIDPGSIVRLL